MEFVSDINQIHSVGDNLWVFTSTVKPGGKEQQVDVFDENGRYSDSFFLRFPPGGRNHFLRKGVISDDGFLFIPEREEDGLVSIGKYKILDSVFSQASRGRMKAPGNQQKRSSTPGRSFWAFISKCGSIIEFIMIP